MKNKTEPYNWKAYYGLKAWQKFLIFFFILSGIAFFVHFSFDFSAILSSASFLFSILVGFFIASAMGNFSRLKTLISQEAGGLIAIYRLTALVDSELSKKIADLIDNYIIARFDWELENYVEKTDKEFFAIFDVLKKVRPENKEEEDALYFIVNNLALLPAARSEIAIVGKSTLNRLYWGLLYALAFVVIVGLYGSIGAEISSKVTTVLLASTVILVLIVLDEIDKNKLNEHDVAFAGYNEVLKSIGKTKYYLDIDVKAGRVRLPEGEVYRLATYKNFPYSFEKEIKLVTPAKQVAFDL